LEVSTDVTLGGLERLLEIDSIDGGVWAIVNVHIRPGTDGEIVLRVEEDIARAIGVCIRDQTAERVGAAGKEGDGGDGNELEIGNRRRSTGGDDGRGDECARAVPNPDCMGIEEAV